MAQFKHFVGSGTRVTELWKHEANDGKCRELGWVCVPMAVEVMVLGCQSHEVIVASGLLPSNQFQQGKGSCPQ